MPRRPDSKIPHLIMAFVSLSLLLAVGIGLSKLLFALHVRPKLEANRSQQELQLQAYLDDLEYLAKNTPFTMKGGEKNDAGAFLNRRVYWTPPVEGFRTEPIVAMDIMETLIRFRGDWMKKYERAKHMKADLSFFSQLSQFDYWDLETESPIEELTNRLRFVPPPQLPVPETNDLLALVKLRLMRGAFEKDFKNALSDVRTFARLMLTTENAQVVLAGLSALDYERIAFRFYVDQFGFPRDGWSPIDRNFTRRAYRAISATQAYLHAWTEPRLLEKLFLAEKEPVGFCAAANEAFPTIFALRPFLEPHWPFELNLGPTYDRLDKIFERVRRSCRIRYLKKLVDYGAIRTKVPGPVLLVDLPYARKIFGLRSSIFGFQGFAAYEVAPY